MGDPPGLSGRPDGPPQAGRPRRSRSSSRSHLVAAVAGVVVAGALIAGAFVLFSGGGEESAPGAATTAQATTAPLPELKILFPEGFTRAEMADRIVAVNEIAAQERGLETRLSAKRYLRATRVSEIPATYAGDDEQRSLEGFLFPATYAFTPKTTTQELVDMQIEAFERAWAKVDLTRAKKKNLTPYDVLIIASMIEGEVQVPKERALVAAVIYNRLRAGIPLGIDATLRYGLDIPPSAPITASQLETDSPYNTRTRTGLPPTPIGNPGLAAMQAAARPAKVDYLWFVRRKDCRSHYFATTEAEFLDFLRGPDSFLQGPNECG